MGLVIVGFPRSGKTTLGQQLAKQLNLPFFDTDWMIEEMSGVDRTAYYNAVGEERFREVECEMLERADPEAIIATGGGIVLREESRTVLTRFDRVAFLKIEKQVLQRRIEKSPLPTKYCDFDEVYRNRLPLYEAVATEVWDGE